MKRFVSLSFGPLADLELLNTLLGETAALLKNLQDDLEDATLSTADRQQRNAELRERLNVMKKEMGGQVGKAIGKMLAIMNQNPEDILTEDEINNLLNATFKKFDKDGSGRLELPEFHKAYLDLKL